MTHPVDITDETFDQEVIQSNTPVLVDFWADWCAPCKMIAPIVNELAEEYDGRIKFTKLDVDSNPVTASNFSIRGIPTMLIFKKGQPVESIVGAVPKSTLKKKLDEIINLDSGS